MLRRQRWSALGLATASRLSRYARDYEQGHKPAAESKRCVRDMGIHTGHGPI